MKKYAGYLTAEELCQQSGLSSSDLERLAEARLLLPDTKDGRYRPKLAGWGKKLSYFFREGWQVEEIRTWSEERWKSENPKQWPPIHIKRVAIQSQTEHSILVKIKPGQ